MSFIYIYKRDLYVFIYIYIYKEIYYKELAHGTAEAAKSQELQLNS